MDEAKMSKIGFTPWGSCNRLFRGSISTPAIFSSLLPSGLIHVKSLFSHRGRGGHSVNCSPLEPSQKVSQTSRRREALGEVNICWWLTLTPPALTWHWTVRAWTLDSKPMPRFALGLFKCAHLHRRGSGGAVSKSKENPEVTSMTLKVPLAASVSFFLFMG